MLQSSRNLGYLKKKGKKQKSKKFVTAAFIILVILPTNWERGSGTPSQYRVRDSIEADLCDCLSLEKGLNSISYRCQGTSQGHFQAANINALCLYFFADLLVIWFLLFKQRRIAI